MGTLSGKYLDGQRPDKSRLTVYRFFDRYLNERAQAAVRAYVELAQRYNLDPAQMALAWINSRPFVTSNIIGATTMEQLTSNIGSAAITLSPELLTEIDELHRVHTIPSP
jgi:aryl-alcohol dehydrogenase-like predicted oxidoreductase